MKKMARKLLPYVLSFLTFSTAVEPAFEPLRLYAEEKEGTKDSRVKAYVEIVKKALKGERVNSGKLNDAIKALGELSKRGVYLNFDNFALVSSVDDLFHLYINTWHNRKLPPENRVAFLVGAAMLKGKAVEEEVVGALRSKDKVILLGAMDAAVYVDTKQIAVSVLEKMFHRNEEISYKAYQTAYVLSSTPEAISFLYKLWKGEWRKALLDLAQTYYLVNKDERMAKVMLDILRREKNKDVLGYAIKKISETDIIARREVREIALARVKNNEEMAQLFILSVEALIKGGAVDRKEMLNYINYLHTSDVRKDLRYIMLARVYLAYYLSTPQDLLPHIDAFLSDSGNIGAIRAAGYLLAALPSNFDNYRETRLWKMLRQAKSERNTELKAALLEELGRNAFEEAVGYMIRTLEESNEARLRISAAKGLYYYNERKSLVYHIDGIKGNVIREISRKDANEKVINYLLLVLGRLVYEKAGGKVGRYHSPNLGVVVEKERIRLVEKPKDRGLEKEISEVVDKEMEKAYEGYAIYLGYLAKSNRLTQTETEKVLEDLKTLYGFARKAKGEKKWKLYKALTFAFSAVYTNYKVGSGKEVAEMLKEALAKNPLVAVDMLRTLRADLVKTKKEILGLASLKVIKDILEEYADKPLPPEGLGEVLKLLLKVEISYIIKLPTSPYLSPFGRTQHYYAYIPWKIYKELSSPFA